MPHEICPGLRSARKQGADIADDPECLPGTCEGNVEATDILQGVRDVCGGGLGEGEVQVRRGKWVIKGECALRVQINIPGGVPGDSVGRPL